MTKKNLYAAIASLLFLSAPLEAEEISELTSDPLLVYGEVIRTGTVICRAGYVMDAYRIEEGYLVARPDVRALEGPNLYEVASLVDLPEAVSSTFHILEEPGPGEPLFGTGWEVTDNQPLIDLARSVGVCETCESGGSTSAGFRAEVEGTVVDVDSKIFEINEVRLATRGEECTSFYTDAPTESPSSRPTGTPTEPQPSPRPTRRPTPVPTGSPSSSPSISPSRVPSASPSWSPSASPSASPSGAPSLRPTVAPSDNTRRGPDCSKLQETFQVPELPVVIDYVVNIDAEDNSRSTLSAQIAYQGHGWLGFGVSPNGGMNGSHVVIGTVEASDALPMNPGKYYLGGHSQEFVTLSPKQTLQKEVVTQNETHTVMSFTRYLEEDGEPVINGAGTNRFVVAYGYDNLFSFHEQRASFLMDLVPCIDHMVNVTGNYTEEIPFPDLEDIIVGGGDNPDAIPFDGEEQPEDAQPGVAFGRSAAGGVENGPADAYAAAGAESSEGSEEASSSAVRMSIALCGLASLLMTLF